MYKVILKKGYDSLEFSFVNYIDASAFMEMALGSGEKSVTISIFFEPEEKAGEE